MFLFYWAILFLLLTGTIAVLEMNQKIPDMLEQPLHDMYADRIIIYLEDAGIMKEVLGDFSYQTEFCGNRNGFWLDNLSVFQGNDEFWGIQGLILLNHSLPDSSQLSEFNKSIMDGELCSSQKGGLWISEVMQKQSGFSCGDTLAFCLNDGTEVCDLTILGVFAEGDRAPHYYISEDVYQAYARFAPEDSLAITIIPEVFRDIFQMVSVLREQGLEFIYSEEAINALSMAFILFSAIVAVLLISLFSILTHLLQFYYNKRRRFFAVNAALGLDSRSTAKILILTAECLVLSALTAAFIAALFYVNAIRQYTGDLFEITAKNSFYSLSTILITLITVQADVALVLYTFFRRNKRINIIDVIREN